MPLRLKDRKLEEKLLAIDPDFLQRVRTIDNVIYEPKENIVKGGTSFVFEILANKRPLGEVVFSEDDIEHIPEYNPNAWNEFPKVTPPKLQPMKIEFIKRIDGLVSKVRTFGLFNGDFWFIPEVDSSLDNYHYDGMSLRQLTDFNNLRFRSWED